MRSAPLLLVPALACLVACESVPLTSASDRSSQATGVEAALVPLSKVDGPQVVKGEIGPGALYGLYLPAEWNGELVLYARGFRPPVWPIVLPDSADPTIDPRFAALRDNLLAQGFALAWSSFSENGFAMRDGVTRTRQLLGLFTSRFGRPLRTYVWGFSLGGAVALQLAEQNPELVDGALTECGVIMGLRSQVNHKFDTRVLFDYFFPGVIPGTAVEFPPDVNFATQVQPQVIAAIQANPAAAIQLAGVDQVELQYGSFTELVQTIVTSLTLNTASWWTGDLYARTNGQPFYDNAGVRYTGSANDELLNLGVQRYAAHPSALNELSRGYTPTGRLTMPVLNLQVRRDPQVPLMFLSEFAGLVDQAGSSQLLLQRVFDKFGHCAVSVPEEITAITDLATWVRSGVRPAS